MTKSSSHSLRTDGFFLAGLETLRGGALIIMMNDLVSTRTALAEHHRAAHSAEQLGGEQIIIRPCGGQEHGCSF